MKLMPFKKNMLARIAPALLLLAGWVSAHAATNKSTLRVMTQGQTQTGLCCTVWSDSVQVTQPERPVPMTVTWSTDYRSTASMLVGLRLNNGPCTLYGPAFLPAAAPADDLLYASATVQWVIMPGDYGFANGVNSVRLCGGGESETDSVTLGFYTLTIRLDK